MEPQGSLLRSRKPVAEPYPKKNEFSPWSHSISLRFILMLSSHPCHGHASYLFLHFIETKQKDACTPV
jgi:hypothetical protein